MKEYNKNENVNDDTMIDYENMSVAEVQRLARQGDKDALFEMAYRYPDNEEAPGTVWTAYWMEKAANKGHIFAKRRYADMLLKIRSEKFAENCQKAMSLFESLVKDFDDDKLKGDDRSVGMVAKIELGIMLCEGVGIPRNHIRGLKLIREGEENMNEIGGMRFAHLVRIGELYAAGYAQEDEDPTRADLVRAIEYLDCGIRNFKSGSDDARMFQHVQQLLDIQEKQLPNKRALEEKRAGLAELPGFPEDMKRAIEQERREYNQKEAKERRKNLEQPTENGRQLEVFLHKLRERLETEYFEDSLQYSTNDVEDCMQTTNTCNDSTMTDYYSEFEINRISAKDYYQTNQPTIANSEEFDLTLDEKSNFPSEGIYIGEYESVTGHRAPALIPLVQTNGLCFLTHSGNKELIYKTMQSIALRLLLSLPSGLCKFTLYDGTGLGTNLISLSNISPKIKGENILTDPDELKRALNAVKTDIPNIVQKVLGQKYFGKTLIDYNREAGELAKPYHFLFITDFPQSLSKEHGESIEKIVASGKQAGVFIIMNLDASYQVKDYSNFNPMTILDSITTIYEAENRYYVRNLPNEKFLNTFRLSLSDNFPDYETIETIQDAVNNSLKGIKQVTVDITAKLSGNNLWKSDGSLGVETPIGKVNITDIQHFTLSIEDGSSDIPHHCLIGGATGAGKTVLLHNIICNTAWLYSPDDVQFILLDYKEGTEFKPYENLPHAKVLSIRSEREYGMSVFNFLIEEIERRGEKFKKINVSNIAKFNERCAEDEKLPRILVVIDEFQKLLDGDARTTTFIAGALDDIGRRGRSFGINLILSTQSLGGVDIRNALSNVGLRIALKLNTTKDCDQLLGAMNHAPFAALTKKGEAIYNARGGLTEGNMRFQTAYLSDSKLLFQINSIKEKVLERYNTDKPFKRFIYDGSVNACIKNNPELNKPFEPNDKKCTVYIGEPVALLETHNHYILRRQNESNVLIIGQDTASAAAILYHSLDQIVPQSAKNSRFYVCDKINTDSDEHGKLNPLAEKYPNLKIVEHDAEIDSVIKEVFDEMEKRKAENKTSDRIVLVMSHIYNARNLRKSGYNAAPPTQSLIAILKDGPYFGIHTIVYANSYADFGAILDPPHSLLNDFEIKIELRGGDGFKMFSGIDAQKSSPTNNFIANLITPQQNENQKIKVYTL